MSDKSDFELAIEQAPPGVIMSGAVTLHKILHFDEKTGKTSTHVVLIGKIGDQEIRKELVPAVIRAFGGRGPMGGLMKKIFGGGEALSAGPSDG